LKDAVKNDLNWFCGQFKMFVIKELFQENATKLSVQKAILDVGIRFPDVDVDGHIKWENHIIEKFNNHLVTEPEARRQMNMVPMTKKELGLTHYEMHVKDLAIDSIREKNKGMIEAQYVRGAEAAGKAAPGGNRRGASHAAKSVANKNRPANQHGRALGPTSARSSMDPNLLYDLLAQKQAELKETDAMNSTSWGKISGSVIDKYIETCLREATENYYTSQEREAIESFRQLAKDRVASTTDLDIISVLLNDLAEQFFEEPDAEDPENIIDEGPEESSS